MPKISTDLDYDFPSGYPHLNKDFRNYKPMKIEELEGLQIEISKDKRVFRLRDIEQFDIVSKLIVDKVIYNKTTFLEIKWTHSKYRKLGYLSYLFELVTKEFNFKLLSDSQQTLEAKEFWKKISQNDRFTICSYNIESNTQKIFSLDDEDLIWSSINNDEFLDISNIGVYDEIEEQVALKWIDEIEVESINDDMKNPLSTIDYKSIRLIAT